jgi:hypothetical protein
MSRLLKFAVAILLAIAGGVLAASPASAASYVTIRHASTYYCLDQTFNTGGPTVDVSYRPSPCASKGSLRWRFEHLATGDNWYRIINSSGWCLSAPNGRGSRVFAELCVPSIPPKQIWRPYANGINGMNRLMSVGSGDCLDRSAVFDTLVTPEVHTCTRAYVSDPGQDFIWFSA